MKIEKCKEGLKKCYDLNDVYYGYQVYDKFYQNWICEC